MNAKLQARIGEAHSLVANAMPNEVLVVHVPDPEKNRIIKVNDIRETRYAEVLAVGKATGRHAKQGAPVKVGEIVVMKTVTAGIGVGDLHYQNKPVHRLDWNDIIAVAEELPHE